MIPAELNTFQIVALLAFGGFLFRSLYVIIKGRRRTAEGIVRVVVSVLGCAAVLNPGALTRVAKSVGIGRGTDLIVYLAVFCMMAGGWYLYLRLQSIRREITILVRQEALRRAGIEPEQRLQTASDDQ